MGVKNRNYPRESPENLGNPWLKGIPGPIKWTSSPRSHRFVGAARRSLEQLLALLLSVETAGATRARLVWPQLPRKIFGPSWLRQVNVELERVLATMVEDLVDNEPPVLLKENLPRLRFVYKVEKPSGAIVLKLCLERPTAQFGHLNSMSVEKFVHSEVAIRAPAFIPKLLFATDSAIALEHIEGQLIGALGGNCESLEEIISSGVEKLQTLHDAQPGRPYLPRDFSKDVDTLVNYWSQKREPSLADLLGSLSKLKLRQLYFTEALDKIWAGFHSYRRPPPSALCAWDFNPTNFIVDTTQNLWLVDGEDFRFSLPVFDFAGLHSMAVQISRDPKATLYRSRRHLEEFLGDGHDENFRRMYEGILAASLVHAAFDSELGPDGGVGGTGKKQEGIRFRFQRFKPLIESLLAD